jgi:hypothetical protein
MANHDNHDNSAQMESRTTHRKVFVAPWTGRRNLQCERSVKKEMMMILETIARRLTPHRTHLHVIVFTLMALLPVLAYIAAFLDFPLLLLAIPVLLALLCWTIALVIMESNFNPDTGPYALPRILNSSAVGKVYRYAMRYLTCCFVLFVTLFPIGIIRMFIKK